MGVWLVVNIILTIWLVVQPDTQGRVMAWNQNARDAIGGYLFIGWVSWIVTGLIIY